jgi:geranylgeranyl pyrophosphate synthase
VRLAVDTEFEAWLREQDWSDDFARAARHVVKGAGKAVRPALVFGFGEVLSSQSTLHSASHRRLALAVEMMHTYSLVHDDLPAMDDDAFRRGRPTLHVLHGDAFAVLAGDALLTASFQALAEAFVSEPEKLPRAVTLLARAAGAPGMIQGQWLDMKAEGQGLADAAALETIHRLKTGKLIAVSASLGALKSLLLRDFCRHENEISAWAEELGLLFQMVDDLLDASASRAELGKTPGKDAESGKLTYVALLGTDELRRRIEILSAKLQVAPAFAADAAWLVELVDFVAKRSR